MKRMRGRSHRNNGGSNGGSSGAPRSYSGNIPLNRNHVFDSSGPDLRVRGTAQQLFEKYLQLGRDATGAGDRVMAESYFQYAEHYFRIVNAMNQAMQIAPPIPGERGPDERMMAPPAVQNEYPRDERVREERPRDDRYRDERPREFRDDRPREAREERPREARDDRPREAREERPREERPREERPREERAPRAPRAERHERAPRREHQPRELFDRAEPAPPGWGEQPAIEPREIPIASVPPEPDKVS